MKERTLLIFCVVGVVGAFVYRWTAPAHRLGNGSAGGIATLAAAQEVSPKSGSSAAPEIAKTTVSPESLKGRKGEDWPQFLGPHQDNTSTETGLLKTWPKPGPPVVWVQTVGNAYSPPAVARGRIVAFHRLGDEEIIDCRDAATGAAIWKHAYPTNYEDRYGYNNGPRGSPSIDGDRVYTYGAEGKLTCVEFETGKPVWQRFLNQEYKVPQGFFGAGASPIIEGDLILLNIGGPEGAGVAGFNKTTGAAVWKTSNDGASYSTPIVRTINGERLAIFLTQDGLLAVEAKTGAESYKYHFRSKTFESVNAASPVVQGDLVFLSATYNVGAALLKLEPGGPKEVWKDRLAMQNHWATSILHDGALYGMDGRHEEGSNFRCIDFATGKIRWTADEGLGRAAFIMADGHLIAVGERGDIALIEVNPDKYIEVSRVHALKYPCWTPPVLSHGLLYIRNENTLACIDIHDPASEGEK